MKAKFIQIAVNAVLGAIASALTLYFGGAEAANVAIGAGAVTSAALGDSARNAISALVS